MNLEITNRPIVLEVDAGKAQLTSILSNIEALVGRASLYGIADPVDARLFVGESEEADFASPMYRAGFVSAGGPGLLRGWTFGRTGTATNVPEGGALETFGDGVPRITNRGLTIAAGSTEYLGYTSDFDSWTKNNVTVTDQGVDYAGQPARKIQVNSDGGGSISRAAAGVGDATGCTFWAVVKKDSGPTDGNTYAIANTTAETTPVIVRVNYDTGEITFDPDSPIKTGVRMSPLGAGWWLLSISLATANGNNLTAYAGFIGASETGGESFLISHAQFENQPFSTSRIINNTGAPISRNSESARIDFSPRGDFTVFVEVDVQEHAISEALFSIDDGTLSNRLTLYRDAAGTLNLQSINAGVESVLQQADKSGARRIRASIASRAGSTSLSVDGAAVLTLPANRPLNLTQMWLGLISIAGQAHLNGQVRRVMILPRALDDTALQAVTSQASIKAIAEAPRSAFPLQARYDPGSGTPGDGEYGTGSIAVYGDLPCDLLICENMGPSAIGLAKTGATMFRDLNHRGRWIDTDLSSGLGLVGWLDARTVRWLNRGGTEVHRWSLPTDIEGTINGLRVTGGKLVINVEGAATVCETWIWNLDGNGYPTGAPGEFASFAGAGKYARSYLIDSGKLWVAALSDPINPQGCEGEVQVYDLNTGVLLEAFYSHYPNDLDRLPDGRIVWVEEHLDRARVYDPVAETVSTLFAGSAIRAAYEPGVSSISANDLASRTAGGLSEGAVEFGGQLYAPNGISVLTGGMFAVADTDNSRIIICRPSDTWRPEIVAVIAMLNEPTKVRVLPD